MGFEIRGPFTRAGTQWTVYVAGWPVPGYIERDAEQADCYRVVPGRLHGAPPPAFATLEEAAQALVGFHARGGADA